MMTNEQLSYNVLKCAYRVHTKIGPGLLEYAYQKCLVYELEEAGFKVDAERKIDLHYGKLIIPNVYRIDIVVENRLIIELKAVERLTENHMAQVNTYLKFTGIAYGLLINFSEKSLKNGIKRIVRQGYNPNEVDVISVS